MKGKALEKAHSLSQCVQAAGKPVCRSIPKREVNWFVRQLTGSGVCGARSRMEDNLDLVQKRL